MDEEGFENLKMKPVLLFEMQSQDAKPFQSLRTLSKFQIAVTVYFRLVFTYLAFLGILPSTLSKHWAVLGLTGFTGQSPGGSVQGPFTEMFFKRMHGWAPSSLGLGQEK